MKIIASMLHLDRYAMKVHRVVDLYSIHRIVYDLYEDIRTQEDKRAGNSSGILFADQGGNRFSRKILLLANRQPKDHIQGQPVQIQSKIVSENFLNYNNYRFRVIMNPTQRNIITKSLRPIRKRQAIAEWFIQRATTQWGFSVPKEPLLVRSIDVKQFAKKDHCTQTIAQAHLEGYLKVTDRGKFKASFTRGIGRAQAYGCGLLQLQPVSING